MPPPITTTTNSSDYSGEAGAGSNAMDKISNGARGNAAAMTAIDRFKFAYGNDDLLLTPAAPPAKPATAKVTTGVVAATALASPRRHSYQWQHGCSRLGDNARADTCDLLRLSFRHS